DPCLSNPCENEGVCESKGAHYKCLCSELYTGKRCQKMKNYCKGADCGHGDCISTLTAPYFKCECRYPYQPPNCTKATSVCNPNPCTNEGICKSEGEKSTFSCTCPESYRGTFCEIGPNECYNDNGHTYRGIISQTKDGTPCIYWNSEQLLQQKINAFMEGADTYGIGEHNFCRNPDDDVQPWCFVQGKKRPKWDYCDVSPCVALNSENRLAATSSPVVGVGETFATCGIAESTGISARVFGGSKTTAGKHPWQVSLQISDGFGGSTNDCGGALIQPCWVLTAAHCVKKGSTNLEVVLGEQDILRREFHEQKFRIEKTIIHGHYKEDNFRNDIALLKLKPVNGQCAQESKYVKTVCVPKDPFPEGQECYISGWGATERDEGSRFLLDAKVKLISQRRCNAPSSYDGALDDGMFCAGNLKQGKVDTCQGDSGGPLTCIKDGQYYVYGIVSWGEDCGLKLKPGVYTRVSKFYDWINSKIKQNS
uniref:Hyaluronan binding protein 2 n=1 Tax=Latimeria chalumnae TaxID=7897 RepID=H2ZX97_LATCH